jgi:hypothetical protein
LLKNVKNLEDETHFIFSRVCVFPTVRLVQLSLTAPLQPPSAAILLVSDNQRPPFYRTANVKSIMVLVSQTRVSLRHLNLILYKSPLILFSFLCFCSFKTSLCLFLSSRGVLFAPFTSIRFKSNVHTIDTIEIKTSKYGIM